MGRFEFMYYQLDEIQARARNIKNLLGLDWPSNLPELQDYTKGITLLGLRCIPVNV